MPTMSEKKQQPTLVENLYFEVNEKINNHNCDKSGIITKTKKYNLVKFWKKSDNSTYEGLKLAIEKGHSIRLCRKEGNSKADVKSVTGLMFDFDGSELGAIAESLLFKHVNFAYESMSSVDFNRFRLVVIFDREIDPDKAEIINEIFIKEWSKIEGYDSSADQLGRLFYGAKQDTQVIELNRFCLDLDSFFEEHGLQVEYPIEYHTQSDTQSDTQSIHKAKKEYNPKPDVSVVDSNTELSTDKTISSQFLEYVHSQTSGYTIDSIYCLYSHNFKAKRITAADKDISDKYEGSNPLSSTNTTGTSFLVSANDQSSMPPYWTNLAYQKQDPLIYRSGSLIDYFYHVGKVLKLHDFSDISGSNFRKFTQWVCAELGIKSFKFPKKKSKKSADSGEDVETDLILNKHQVNNISLLRLRDIVIDLCKDLDIKIRLNIMTKQFELWKEGKHVSNFNASISMIQFQEIFGVEVTNYRHIEEIVYYLGNENKYHPMAEKVDQLYRDRIDSLPSPDILNSFVQKYFNMDNSQYSQKELDFYNHCIKIMLVGTLNRVYQPGCEFQICTILQGIQGIGKTTFFRNLCFYPDWVTEDFDPLSKDKDQLSKLTRYVFLSLDEIDGVVNRGDKTALRTLITTTIDTYRLPYARSVESYSRSSIFVGSVNPTQFLMDEHGSRRFHVIALGKNTINVNAVATDRDDIWLAARQLQLAGFKTYLTGDDVTIREEINEVHSHSPGVIFESIERYIADKEQIAIYDICISHFNKHPSEISRGMQLSIAEWLNRMGWGADKKRVSLGSKRVRLYTNPDKDKNPNLIPYDRLKNVSSHWSNFI